MKSFFNFIISIHNKLYSLFSKAFLIFQSLFFNIYWEKLPNVSGFIFIRGRGKIIIGRNVMLISGRKSNPLGGETKLCLVVSKGATLKIGNNCGISNSVLISTKSITIEDNVLIGNGCKIYDTDFHPILPEDRLAKKVPKSSPILIKSNAFIGAHTIILKGVTIGKNAVIGAGSVITKDVPDNEVWAGNPAKFIKKIYEQY